MIYTTDGQCRIYIPNRGVIRSAQVYILCTTIAGSAEDVAISLRLNATTDYAIETKGLDAGKKTLFSNYLLNIPVEQGDYFAIKMVCPIWVTNPSSIYIECVILVFT